MAGEYGGNFLLYNHLRYMVASMAGKDNFRTHNLDIHRGCSLRSRAAAAKGSATVQRLCMATDQGLATGTATAVLSTYTARASSRSCSCSSRSSLAASCSSLVASLDSSVTPSAVALSFIHLVASWLMTPTVAYLQRRHHHYQQ